jgi:radical SAM superfamily enzyme YgiQ (UPF0313 family)
MIEENVVRKKYRKGMLRIAVAYPSNYRVGMQSLSVHMLHQLLNSMEGVIAERVFMEGEGPYVSVESGASLRDFHMAIFSVHYELDYPGIIRMLRSSGIEPRRDRRMGPLIVAGGPPLMANPEPMAMFMDLLAIGELEVVVPNLVGAFMEFGLELENYADLEGIYVPSLGKYSVTRAFVRDMGSCFTVTKAPVPIDKAYSPIFGNKLMVEVMRGCGGGCLFCMEGYVTRPLRYRRFSELRGIIERSLRTGAHDGVVLLGLSVGDHPEFKELMRYLVEELGVGVSVPSLRVDSLDEEAIGLIAKGGQRVLTIAPESSERLRYALGKRFSDAEVVEKALVAAKYGMDHVKLYLMVGLPGETMGDIDELVRLVNKVRSVGVRVHLSVNPWIPKPQTPLQWFPMMSMDELRTRIRRVRDSSWDRFSSYDVVYATAQALLSLGDRDVGDVVLRASYLGHGRGSWRRILREEWGLVKKYVYSRKEPGSELPWSHIRGLGTSEELLAKLYRDYCNALGIT